MDFRTISATLAMLGTGLALSACNKTQTDATEVPAASSSSGSEASCKGAKADGHCGEGSKHDGEASCKGEAGCKGEKTDPAAATPAATAASDTAPADSAATPAATSTTTAKKKPAAKKKAAKGGEGACGEGTCG
jgi:hypothetical protein